MKKTKSKLYFFFSLIGTLLLSACGIRNHHGFIDEDARFANYTFLGNDGDGSTGLAYYADETNPNEIAVGLGTCREHDITVTTYDGKPVTSVFPSGFLNCDSIRTISLPDTVTTFGTDAFAGSTLNSITIPNGLTVISSGAFRNCKELVEVDFDKENNTVTAINDYAFANDFKLSSFPFHKITHLTSVGKEAFLYCLGLRSVIFPKGFTTLGSYAFQDCKGLTTIYFPDSIASIGEFAFRGVGQSAKIYFCEEREDVVSDLSLSDPNPGTTIPFEDAHNFSYGNYHVPIIFGVGELIIKPPFHFLRPDDGSYVLNKYTSDKDGNWAEDGTPEFTETIAEDEVILWNYEDDGRTTLDIPSTVEWGESLKVVGIKNNVFKDNKKITSVTFNENLRFIDAAAFFGCTKLTNIDLRGAVDLEHIQSRAFYNTMLHNNVRDVNHMYSVHIPANVKNIAVDAFRSCTGLFKVYFDGATNEYEETFLCPGNVSSFELQYAPTNLAAVTSVTVDGPSKSFTLSDKTITITGTAPRKNGVLKVKYTTNATTTQKFVGHKESLSLVSEFTLSSKAEAIASVTIDGVAQVLTDDYTVTNVGQNENTKTKITFNNAPDEDSEIVVTYRALPKLTKIDDCAFYSCSNGLGDAKFYDFLLKECDNPYQNVYFPASLREIGKYAFANGDFVGGAIFGSSNSLKINEHAFYDQRCLSSIVFPSDMGGLDLYNKCFAAGMNPDKYAAGNAYKKLISVTLPSTTTVSANEIFAGRYSLSIYCLGNQPVGYDSKTSWNLVKVGSNSLPYYFGDFKTAQGHLDKAPVYIVDSEDDIVSVPNKKYPIFDFVREHGSSSATLTNYHYYGGRIKDANGNQAITPGKSLATANAADRNGSYNSEYAVMLSNGHFRAEIPIKVKIGNSYLDVTKIGQSAMAFQINTDAMKPNTGSKNAGTGYTSDNGYKYWQSDNNLFTMREIVMPHTIDTIAAGALAIVPIVSLRSYYSTGSKDSGETVPLSKIWNGTDDANITEEGKFPKALEILEPMAFSFTGLTNAILPNGLREFSGFTSSTASNSSLWDNAWYSFVFIGCFHLTKLNFYDIGGIANPVFTTNDEGTIISFASNNVMIEGAEGITKLEIPWGTTKTAGGALRGARRITSLAFPYTLTNVAKFLLDTIGSSVDWEGWCAYSSLQNVSFKDATEYGEDASQQTAYPTPRCTEIGEVAFWGASSISNLELPVSLVKLGSQAFRNCAGLTNISIDNGTGNSNTQLGTDLDFTQFPSLTTIGSECFGGCTSLTSVTTSSRIAKLDSSTFTGCKKLATATIDAYTKTIGSSCFYNCNLLDTITFNGTGVTLDTSAFYNCDALTTITVPSDSKINGKVFDSCDGFLTGKGIIIGERATFTKVKDNSAFINCPVGTKIFLMDDEATFKSRQSSGKYPAGWNFRSWNGSSGDDLTFYCLNDAASDTIGDFPHWHMVAGVPTPW